MDKSNYTYLAIVAYSLMALFYLIELYLVRKKIYTNGSRPGIFVFRFPIGNREITRKDFENACVWGGLIAGFLGASLILILYITHHPNWIGYGNMDPKYFTPAKIILFYLFQIFLGGFLGWLCGNFVWTKEGTKENKIKKSCQLFLIFISAFVCIIFFRQLMARDALIKPGGYEEKADNLNFLNDTTCIDMTFKNSFHWNKEEKKFVRMGGGYLGEPDFETLATGLMGGIAFLILVAGISKLFRTSVQLKRGILSNKGMLLLTGRAAFLGFISWMTVFVMYFILTQNCIIRKYDVIYRRWIFAYDFPHPERFLFVFVLCAIYLFSMLLFIRKYSVINTNASFTYTT